MRRFRRNRKRVMQQLVLDTAAVFSTVLPDVGYYVDANGKVRSINQPPPNGCHFLIEDKGDYTEVLEVVTKTGEIIDGYVLFPSIESMVAAGVDCSAFKE